MSSSRDFWQPLVVEVAPLGAPGLSALKLHLSACSQCNSPDRGEEQVYTKPDNSNQNYHNMQARLMQCMWTPGY